MKRLEFHISYACVNNCVFCSERDRMRAFRKFPVTKEEIQQVLSTKRGEGFDYVCFTGGEPTLHPQFRDILRMARQLGFATGVTTNGVMLASVNMSRRCLPLLDEVQISVHGPEAELHDRLTRREGSFQRLKEALCNLSSSDGRLRVSANIMVTRANCDALRGIVQTLRSCSRLEQILLSTVAPEGNGARYLRELTVRLSRWKDLVPAVADLCGSAGIGLRVFGVPPCVLGGDWRLANDLHWDQRVTIERGMNGKAVSLVAVVGKSPTRDRIKPPKCRSCAWRAESVCGGMFRAYFELFGDDELRPFVGGSESAPSAREEDAEKVRAVGRPQGFHGHYASRGVPLFARRATGGAP